MKDKSLLLMSCRSPYLDSDKVYPPLANLYLKAAVNEQLPNTKVDLADEYDLSDKTMFNGYTHVGISIMTPQREEASKVIEAIRYNSPDTKIVLGGPHVHHYLDESLGMGADFLVPNDGQRSLVNILKVGIASNRTPVMYKDIMSRSEWSAQPRPDRTSDKALEFLAGYSYNLNGKKAGTLLTATGCPMLCTFCEDAETRVRWSPLEKIGLELDDIKAQGNEGVYLFDDLFAIAQKKVEPITELIADRGLIYRCNGQANFFTKNGEDFAKMLADTGCVEIAFGHETGSQKILDNTRKQTTVLQNYQSVEFAKKHGINVKSFLMLGLPGETEETIKATEKFIEETQPDDFQLAVYSPYKGTQIRDAIDAGDDTQDLFFEGEKQMAYGQKGGKSEACVRTGELSSDELLAHRDRIVEKYRPKSHTAAWDDKFFDTHLT